MPAVNSKTDAASTEAKAKKQQLRLVQIHCAINMAVSMMNFTSRGILLQEVLGGDYSKVAGYMSTWTGVTALIEFCLNPTLGKLSDAYGRKTFMVIAPYAALVLKTIVLMFPSVSTLTLERIVCDGLRTMSGTTMGSAAITDLVPKDQLGKAYSELWAWMGMAIIGSPLLASRMSARGSYVAALLLASVQLVADQFYLKETLPREKRKAFPGFANPLEVFRLFNSGKTLQTASALTALQNMLDPKILADFWIILQLEGLQWSSSQSQLFTGFIGFGLIAGRKITSWGLDKYGIHGFTTMCHYVNAVEMFLIGLLPSTMTMGVSSLLGFMSGQKSNGVKQMLAKAAFDRQKTTRDFGNGELSGLQANLRALMVSISPFLYAAFYRAGKNRGMKGGAFIGAAIVVMCAEMMHKRLRSQLKEIVIAE